MKLNYSKCGYWPILNGFSRGSAAKVFIILDLIVRIPLIGGDQIDTHVGRLHNAITNEL